MLRLRPFVLVASLAAFPATAQNLLTNPDFTGSLSGWSTSSFASSTATFGGSTGSTALGAAILTAGPGAERGVRGPHGSNPYVILRQCVSPIEAGSYDLKAHTHTSNASGDASNQVAVVLWDGLDCGGNPIDELATNANADFSGISPTNWTERSRSAMTFPQETMSVAVELLVDAGTQPSSTTVYFDHVFFGLAGTPVTLQSFDAE